jgi:large subunit ribosomal protein L20
MSYSKFIGDLKKRNISLNRKALAFLAFEHPEDFKKLFS